MAKKEKFQTVMLKQRRPHAKGFRLGRHLITMGAAKAYELNESELKELSGNGPKAWLKVVTEKEIANAPASNADNKEMQDLKKDLGDRVELKGDESLEELKELKEEVDMMDALVEECKKAGIEISGEETIENLEELLSNKSE